MAIFILLDAFVLVNGVNLSNHGNHVEVNSEKDLEDVTTFGATSKVYLLGLGDGTMSFSFYQDFAGGSVDATLQPIHSGGTPVALEVRATSAGRSATNPAYTMTGVLPTYQPFNGDVGAASAVDCEFQNAAAAGIVRAIA